MSCYLSMTETNLKSFCNSEALTTLSSYTIFRNFYTNSYFGIYGDANYHKIKVMKFKFYNLNEGLN